EGLAAHVGPQPVRADDEVVLLAVLLSGPPVPEQHPDAGTRVADLDGGGGEPHVDPRTVVPAEALPEGRLDVAADHCRGQAGLVQKPEPRRAVAAPVELPGLAAVGRVAGVQVL